MLRSEFRLEKCNKGLKKHNSDFVLDNFVETEVKSLLPLYLAQCLSLAPKYSIRYDFITSNSSHFCAFVSLCAVVIAAFWFYFVFDVLWTSGTLYSITLFAYSITVMIVYIINSTVTTSKSNMSAFLIILIQKIHRDFKYVKFNTRNITIVDWIFVTAMIVFNVLHFVLRLVEERGSVIRMFLVHFMYVDFNFTLIIEVRLIYLLGKYIDTWILELENVCCANSLDDRGTDYNIQNKEARMKKIITAYDKILEALDICNKIFGLSILFTVVMSFIQVFFNLQYIILVSIYKKLYSVLPSWKRTMYISQTLWIKNITLLSILCMESENVCLKMKNAEVACTMLSATDSSAELCRVLHLRGPRASASSGAGWLSAAGFFSVDAALPPRFLAVLATYTVVILKFYFL
nr:gustatory receptor 45.1 [Papilio machaon]